MVPPSHGHTAHAAVLFTHLKRYQLFQQFLPVFHIGNLIDKEAEGGDERCTVLSGDEDIAVQTLFIDELGNFPDTVQLCGFTAAYTIEGGMLVLGLFLRCCLWVELLLDLVGINDEVFVAGVPEVDIDRTVYGFDGTLFEPPRPNRRSSGR